MTAHETPLRPDDSARAGECGHFGQLCAIVTLVERMAPDAASDAPIPDDDAIAGAYHRASAVAQRRFDALSREAAEIATAGVEALIASEGSPQAAARLAGSLRCSIERLVRLVGQD